MNESAQTPWNPAFDEKRRQEVVAGDSAFVRAEREKVFEQYKTAPAPHGRIEEWRRTDPAGFSLDALDYCPRIEQVPGSRVTEPWMSAFDAVVTIRDTEWTVQDLSGALGKGLFRLESLREAGDPGFDLLQEAVTMGLASVAPHKLALLGRAFWNIGVRVAIPDGAELEKGVLIRYAPRKTGTLLLPRVVVSAGRRSRASVFEQISSPDEGDLLLAASRDLFVGEGGQLRFITLQNLGAGARYLADDRARVERDGRLHWIGLNFGARLGKMNFSGNVAGPGASVELDGLFFASGRQHLDQRTLQIHSAPNTTSNLLYKGAVRDTARSVYQGLIIARPGAVQVDAYQKNNNLVLNEGARADSLPGLEIDTDDLKCSHGSTIGNLDEELVYYLRSRGLDEAQARRTLLKGFFEEIAARIPWAYGREQVEQHVEQKIG